MVPARYVFSQGPAHTLMYTHAMRFYLRAVRSHAREEEFHPHAKMLSHPHSSALLFAHGLQPFAMPGGADAHTPHAPLYKLPMLHNARMPTLHARLQRVHARNACTLAVLPMLTLTLARDHTHGHAVTRAL